MSHTPAPHRTWVEIDLAALRHNAGVARRLAGPDGGVMAVVKADAYGLGTRWIAPALATAGIDAFAVSTLTEACELHSLGITAPVYLLSPATPAEQSAVVATQHGAASPIIPAVASEEDAIQYAAIAAATGTTVAVHVVIDTGMGRIGILENEALATVLRIAALPGLVIDSIGSHLPSADEDEIFTAAQLTRYHALLKALATAGVRPARHHIANSAGTLQLRRHNRELVRTGLMLCGISPIPESREQLQPVVTWYARVVSVRTLPAGHGISYGRTFVTPHPIRVATLAVGYADGYPRHLSGQGAWVQLGNQRCPVLGRITMDQIMVEAPATTQPGDAATLMGGHGPDATELATRAGTIPYEIICGLGRRVVRVPVS